MTTFQHNFFRRVEQWQDRDYPGMHNETDEARVWHNADGSEGGIVACRAIVCKDVFIAPGAEVGPRASLSNRCHVGQDAVVYADARFGDGCRIGRGSLVNSNAYVLHGTRIGEGAYVGYNTHMRGGDHIGDRAVIGDKAILGGDCYIGADVRIGDGVVVRGGTVVEAADWLMSVQLLNPLDENELLFPGAGWSTAVWSPAHGLRWWHWELPHRPGISSEALQGLAREEWGNHDVRTRTLRHTVEFVAHHPKLAEHKKKHRH